MGYAVHRSVDPPAAAPLTLGAAGGAVLGTRLLGRLPARTLRLAFAGLMLVTAIRLFAEPGGAHHSRPVTPAIVLKRPADP